MHGVTGYPFYGSSTIKVWLFIRFLISFKDVFNQAFLEPDGNLVTSEILGYVMKFDTSDPDSTKVGNELFNSFTTAFNTLCGNFPILFAEISAPFHSLCASIIRSLIFNL